MSLASTISSNHSSKRCRPLVAAHASGDQRAVIDRITVNSLVIHINTGPNAKKTLRYMMELSKKHLKWLARWAKGSTKEALIYVRDYGPASMSDRSLKNLRREPRSESLMKMSTVWRRRLAGRLFFFDASECAEAIL